MSSLNLLTTTVVGASVPLFTPHAICTSLPTWEDNINFKKGEKRVLDSVAQGYPRFTIHPSVRKLAGICEQRFGATDERCLLFPTSIVANHCRAFIIQQATKEDAEPPVRITQFLLHPDGKDRKLGAELHIVLFPADKYQYARPFWQHTGLGISSRYADYCLSLLPEEISPASPTAYTGPESPHVCHSVKEPKPLPVVPEEEPYGRNHSPDAVASTKRILHRRIADTFPRDGPADRDAVGSTSSELQPDTRSVGVTEGDVYLYPSGMASIWGAYQTISAVRPEAKSVVFGWLYTDTVKILEKWGRGCHFFGFGNEQDIDRLEALLEEESKKNPGYPPITFLATEFPTNPLVNAPNLRRLRALADKYEFPIVVDQTIGNFNLDVMPYADVVVDSLSKIFSGYADVMGGSLVLNAQGRHYRALKDQLSSAYEDMYYGEDALCMERNSRDFEQRVKAIDGNTEAVCELLRSHVGGAIKQVFYPKWTSRENYEQCRKRGPDGVPTGGFGGLFSITFHLVAASRAFFDALPINKGATLGTNFSLACPYTVISRFGEYEWAERYGVEEGLIRISVGMEDREDLLGRFKIAIEAAEAAKVHGQPDPTSG